MARDHRRLRVFQAAHTLTLTIYKETRDFPRDEWYGLRAQLRRAAISTVSNIVEGNARRGALEYANFLNIARASAAEAAYLVLVASELGYFPVAVAACSQREYAPSKTSCGRCTSSPSTPLKTKDQRLKTDESLKPRAQSLKPKAYVSPPGLA